MTKQKRILTIVLLGLLTAVVPFSIDMYLPGFPDIALSMNTTVSKVALSLSSFFVGVALGQLAYGPLMDRFGRKVPLYAGLIFYCIISVACSFTTTIESFIILRFAQAIGACAASVATTAMVRDFFPPEENAKIFSFLILVLSASPLLAPTLGGYLISVAGWQSVFIALSILIAVILIGVFFLLSNARGADKSQSLNIISVAKGYRAVFNEGKFIVYAITGAIGFACLFTYIAGSPGIFMGVYGLTQKQYGFMFAFIASGLIICSQINNVLLNHFSSEQIVKSVLIAQNLFGVAMLGLVYFGVTNLWIVILMLFCFLAPIGFIMPNASALAMQRFTKNTGSAAALLGFMQMAIGSLATVLMGILDITNIIFMSTGLLACSVLALTYLLWGEKYFSLLNQGKNCK